MPRHCSVYGCRSNYDKERTTVSTFSLPRDEKLRKLWLEHIPTDFSQLKSPSVCIKHFAESVIKRVDRVMVNGEMKEYQRKIPRLINDAVPTIFPKCVSNGRKKRKVKCLPHGEDQQGTEVKMDSHTTVVIPETYHTECIKTEIKEEVLDVNEGSIETELLLEEQSIQNGMVCIPSPCVNNQVFHANNLQTNVKIEIKEEPVWFENTLVEANGESDAHLQNEYKEVSSLITGVIEDKELQSLRTGVAWSKDRGVSSFTLKQEQCSGLEDDNVDNSEDSVETHEFEQFEKSSASVNKTHRCEICDASFKRAFCLKRHKITHDDKKYKCGLCGRNFKCRVTLTRHTITHSNKRSFKCEICNVSFKMLLSLKRHKLTHDDNITYKCEHCEKIFKWSSSLRRHSIIHHGKKSHQRGTLEETFNSKFALKLHTLHDKPHKCEVCEKSFRWKSHLRQHRVVHEHGRPYNCKVCKKGFKRLSHLTSHVTIHEEVRPHKCEICDKSFTQTSSLNRHYLSHQFHFGAAAGVVCF